MVGPFKTAPGGYTHIFVADDKLTKWIEVKAVTSIESAKAAQFMEEITHCFGVPNRIITDLGKQFTNSEFWDFSQDNLIDVYYSSVAHQRCNGQVECANWMVLKSLKSHIFDNASKYATKWLRELPHVIWGLRTLKSWATGYTPFFMVYGSEAVLPSDVAFGTPRIQYYEEGKEETSWRVDIDSLEEHRVAALIQHARHEQQIRHYHNRNVREHSFNFGDLVLCRIQSTNDMHKLTAP
ncbi:uncharacterized protein [Setaria viridis]|uniref:uncharacterized protein n=1 Tax=Setaria viridis TaxID=4556 RepID=UPI003B3A1402